MSERYARYVAVFPSARFPRKTEYPTSLIAHRTLHYYRLHTSRDYEIVGHRLRTLCLHTPHTDTASVGTGAMPTRHLALWDRWPP